MALKMHIPPICFLLVLFNIKNVVFLILTFNYINKFGGEVQGPGVIWPLWYALESAGAELQPHTLHCFFAHPQLDFHPLQGQLQVVNGAPVALVTTGNALSWHLGVRHGAPGVSPTQIREEI